MLKLLQPRALSAVCLLLLVGLEGATAPAARGAEQPTGSGSSRRGASVPSAKRPTLQLPAAQQQPVRKQSVPQQPAAATSRLAPPSKRAGPWYDVTPAVVEVEPESTNIEPAAAEVVSPDAYVPASRDRAVAAAPAKVEPRRIEHPIGEPLPEVLAPSEVDAAVSDPSAATKTSPQVVTPAKVALQPRPMPPAPQRIAPSPAKELIPTPTGSDDLPAFTPLKLSGINQVTTSIAPPTGDQPRNYAALAQPGDPQPLAPPGELARTSAPFYSTPRVPDFTHRPLYFEEKALERNGRTIGVLQPGLSAAHFFGTIPILPYKMGAQPPSRPMYTGDGIDLPSDHLTVRDRVRGVMTQAGVVLGLNYALP